MVSLDFKRQRRSVAPPGAAKHVRRARNPVRGGRSTHDQPHTNGAPDGLQHKSARRLVYAACVHCGAGAGVALESLERCPRSAAKAGEVGEDCRTSMSYLSAVPGRVDDADKHRKSA